MTTTVKPRQPTRLGHQIALGAAIAVVLCQIAWVLVPEGARDAVTITSVLLFATASLSHATATRGWRWAAQYAAIVLLVGWGAEAIGTTTGWPFGSYDYTDNLGAKLGPVPLVIPLAWLMMSYPILLAARAVTDNRVLRIGYGAALLTSWDLFLDPQMVDQGHWIWFNPGLQLPGIPGIPAQNFAGWFLVGVVLFTLATSLPERSADDRVPSALLIWVFASNVLANAAFWGRPTVALIGGLAMGALLIPWLRTGVATRQFWVPSG